MKQIRHDIAVYNEKNDYDIDNRLMLDCYANRILEKRKDHSECSLLELGLGHGYTSKIFHKQFCKHTIIEGDKQIIEHFKEQTPGFEAEIIHTFFEDYCPNEKYDVIVAGFVLEHVENPLAILNSYKEYLAEKGVLYIAVPNSHSLNRLIGWHAGLLEDINILSENDIRLGHRRYFSKESLTQLCDEAGLLLKSIEGIYLKPITTKQAKILEFDSKIYQALLEIGRNYPELSCGILAECMRR